MAERFDDSPGPHTAVPWSAADQAAATSFVTGILTLSEQSTCDRACMVSAFLTVATALAVKDLACRPGMVAFYVRAVREVVDDVMDAAPQQADHTH